MNEPTPDELAAVGEAHTTGDSVTMSSPNVSRSPKSSRGHRSQTSHHSRRCDSASKANASQIHVNVETVGGEPSNRRCQSSGMRKTVAEESGAESLVRTADGGCHKKRGRSAEPRLVKEAAVSTGGDQHADTYLVVPPPVRSTESVVNEQTVSSRGIQWWFGSSGMALEGQSAFAYSTLRSARTKSMIQPSVQSPELGGMPLQASELPAKFHCLEGLLSRSHDKPEPTSLTQEDHNSSSTTEERFYELKAERVTQQRMISIEREQYHKKEHAEFSLEKNRSAKQHRAVTVSRSHTWSFKDKPMFDKHDWLKGKPFSSDDSAEAGSSVDDVDLIQPAGPLLDRASNKFSEGDETLNKEIHSKRRTLSADRRATVCCERPALSNTVQSYELLDADFSKNLCYLFWSDKQSQE